MNSDNDRSNKFPRRNLSNSIALAFQLLNGVSKAGADVKTTASVLGYTSVSGATKTALAAMRLYGLIEKPHGKDTVVPSEALIRLHTATSQTEKSDFCRKLALNPPLFAEMHSEGLNSDDTALLLRWLMLQNLPERAARTAARIYSENARFVGLGQSSPGPFQLPLSSEIKPAKRTLPLALEVGQPAAKPEGIRFDFALVTCDASISFSRDFGEADLKSLRQYLDLLEQSWRVRQTKG